MLSVKFYNLGSAYSLLVCVMMVKTHTSFLLYYKAIKYEDESIN